MSGYYIIGLDGKSHQITDEQYRKMVGDDEMDNRVGWGDFKYQQAVNETGIIYNSAEGVMGTKHDFNKPEMSLLPMKDLEGVVRVLEFGAKKYARGDWKHVPNGAFRYLDAGLRHTGELTDATTIEELRVVDPESRLPAIDHAICSLIFARHFIFKGFKEGEDDK